MSFACISNNPSALQFYLEEIITTDKVARISRGMLGFELPTSTMPIKITTVTH